MTGIRNVSGVSCHLSCALQLLAHGIPPLTNLLRELLPILNHDDRDALFLQHLGAVLTQLTSQSFPHEDDDDGVVIDPTALYQVLEKQTSLDPQDVGDVSTAVYQIFQVMGKRSPQWKEAVDYLIGTGQTQQLICGLLLGTTRLRIKRGKVKSMACPFPLPGLGERNHSAAMVAVPSVTECVAHLIDPSPSDGYPIQDYDWENQDIESYTEEEEWDATIQTDYTTSSSITWRTTRCLQILEIPRCFFCSLDRFAYSPSKGERILKLAEMDVATQMTVKGQDYRLKGGVIHVSDESIAEEGHYVTLIAVGGDTTESWRFIDDESSRAIDNETAQRYLRGTETEDGTYYCAVLVLYSRLETEDDEADWVKVASSIRDQYAAVYADWSKPESLVGRKLKVSWAKGRVYSGVVDSYDITTGKHRVLYDDGDVREYDLQKKTIHWL